MKGVMICKTEDLCISEQSVKVKVHCFTDFSMCCLLEILVFKGSIDLKMETNRLHSLICTTFVFCYLWSIGGNLIESCWDLFDTFVRNQFEDNGDAKVNKC